MAQNTKSLVRLWAHDIILAQQIHYACPVSLVFHDLTGANVPTNAPSPRLTPQKKNRSKVDGARASPTNTLQWLLRTCSAICCPSDETQCDPQTIIKWCRHALSLLLNEGNSTEKPLVCWHWLAKLFSTSSLSVLFASRRKQPGRPLLPPAQAAQEFQLCSHAGTRAKNAAYFESGKTPCGGDEVHMAPFLLCPPSPAQPAAAAGIAAMGSGRCTALRSPIIP